jgi:mono/diheme cytochrome c family protein
MTAMKHALGRGARGISLLALALRLSACVEDEQSLAADLLVDAAARLDAGLDADMRALDASSSMLDAIVGAPDATVALDAFVLPAITFPSAAPARPFLLSEVALYADMSSKLLAPDVVSYEPLYVLWSDGAEKARHYRLPAGSKIDTADPDHWQFPVGTMFFKEFARGGKKLETRLLARTGPDPRDYFFGSFVWLDDESDAVLAWDGMPNVRGTEHDVPSVKQCGTCHNGEPGRVLGFSAVQTPLAASTTPLRFASIPQPYRVPGTQEQADALGYLHANCGHCHNPSGSARPDTDLMLRLSIAEQSVMDTRIYQTSVGKPLQSFQGSALTLRVVAGQPEQSGLYFRMSQRGPRTQMPPIASELVDPAGLATLAAFITHLP